MQIAKLFFIIITGAALLGGWPETPARSRQAQAEQAERRRYRSKVAEATTMIRALDNGADVNAKNDDGDTPLHRAAYNNAAEVAKLLIDKGAEVNAKNKISGGRLCMRAANYKAAEVAKLLIDKGAEVNAKDKDGNTPLHWAAANATGGGCETAD